MLDYACNVCGRPAPPLDSLEILEWAGGELAYNLDERDPLMLGLVCPACKEPDSEEET